MKNPLRSATSLTLGALLVGLAPLTPALQAKDPSTMIVADTDTASPVKYPEDFEAEIEMQAKELGEKAMTMKVYKLGTKQRVEMNAMGQELITLVDTDKQKATTLIPSQKLATIMGLNSTTMPLDLSQISKDASGATYKETAREKVGDVDAIKYDVIDADGKKSADLWASATTQYPVKLVPAKGETSITWKKLVDTKPDPALFTVPAEYKVMDMGNLDPAMLNGLKDMLK